MKNTQVELLEDFDSLHCTGQRLLARLIRKFTRSEFSHTAIFRIIEGVPCVIDAQRDGVQVRTFERWQKEYNYKYVVTRDPDLTVGEIHAMKKRIYENLDKGYDFESLLLRQPWKIITGKWKTKQDEKERLYCSEFAELVYGKDDSERTTPQDFFMWCVNKRHIVVE